MYFEFQAKHERDFNYLIVATVRLRVQIWVRLYSPLMNFWTSTREYLEVSNIFVRYKANGSVLWLSWELNLFMNMFVTFAIRSWLLLLICYCHWLHSVILKSSYEGLLYIYIYTCLQKFCFWNIYTIYHMYITFVFHEIFDDSYWTLYKG